MNWNPWILVIGIILIVAGIGLIVVYIIEYVDKKNKTTKNTILIIAGSVLLVIGLGMGIFYLIKNRRSKKQALEEAGASIIDLPSPGYNPALLARTPSMNYGY